MDATRQIRAGREEPISQFNSSSTMRKAANAAFSTVTRPPNAFCPRLSARSWQGQRNLNMESIYEYGARSGFWRLWRAFTRRNMPVTVYGVTLAMARNPEAVAAMKEADWEIASHGLRWWEYKDVPEEIEREHIRDAVRLHTELTGSRPLGIYQGKPSDNTLKLVMEEGGFLYSADSYADELPYWVEGPKGPHLIVPYTLDANDMRFATPQGFNSGDQFYTYLKDTFDVLYREGAEGAPKMMSIGLHCRLVGRPGRVAALERFLDYVQSHDKVWVAKRVDIARHWHENYKPVTADVVPSKASRDAFVARYGSIFEHSPWIAERAYDAGFSLEEDAASGLAAAMTKAFRAASTDERLAVLKAHPDLAGKLAQAKRLTAESTAEQAGAGLDALTDAEKQTFTELNDAYTAKFGFPFIIAVKGRNKRKSSTLSSAAFPMTAIRNLKRLALRWSASPSCASRIFCRKRSTDPCSPEGRLPGAFIP